MKASCNQSSASAWLPALRRQSIGKSLFGVAFCKSGSKKRGRSPSESPDQLGAGPAVRVVIAFAVVIEASAQSSTLSRRAGISKIFQLHTSAKERLASEVRPRA